MEIINLIWNKKMALIEKSNYKTHEYVGPHIMQPIVHLLLPIKWNV